ncbi:TonB-dependent receptor domain-containing protein [Melioribacteraceae bacterium 4301-Me]|uniref:TonB-dependent receptor n=1 Tax=Pyranulibacter aquaticus TaxID=3163344 RepID=UPI003596BFAD
MNYNKQTKSMIKTLLNIISLSFILSIVILLFPLKLNAQSKGSVSGKVVDSTTGEAVIGANVLLSGTNFGDASDIEGKYLISNVEEGTYEIAVSCIGYAKKKISNVEVKANSNTVINITLQPEAISVEEVVVTSKAENSYEAALINLQKNAVSISDGISAEQIKKSPDATSSDALRRITGVSVVDNKFVFVRGTSERYSYAMLNNVSLSSTEPDKKSFAFDLIPTNLLDNIIIDKSYSVDKPGDFGGGLVKMNTIDFPDKIKLNITLTGSYTNNTSLNNFRTYKGGKLDFLGIDDGTRSLPSHIPPDLSKGNYTPEQMLEFAKQFPNNWSTTKTKAPINGSFLISFGDGITLFGPRFGFVTALSYKNNFVKTNLERNEYEASGEPRFNYSGDQYTYSTLWGGLLNVSYKINDLNKISLKNTYSHASNDEVSQLHGAQFTDSGTEQFQSAIRFDSREVYSGQLMGEHVLPNINGLKFDWRVYNSISNKNEPDYRRVIYARELGTQNPFAAVLGFQVNLKNGGRFYSNLHEDTKGIGTDFTLPVANLKIKFGALFDKKERGFNSRLFGTIINAPGNGFTDFNLLYLPIDKIFAPENYRKNGFSIQEYLNGTNNYNASENISAFYSMFELPIKLFEKELRIIAGGRLENSQIKLNSRDLSDQKDIVVNLKNIDFLPSLNFIYKINDNTNLRLSANRTVNRPELRELAPFAYFDFYTQTSIRGNENLQRAEVQNYDLRLETFPEIGEMISASIFYKKILNAIEQVVITGSALGSERTFRNSDNAKLYGIELEGRFSLGHISNVLDNFLINGNYSWVKSSVTVKGSETTIPRDNRPLQGQSPYTINLGVTYNNQSWGTSFSLLYNRNGERIVEVATEYEEDIIEEPRNVIDIVFTQQIKHNLELKLTAKNLLGQNQIFKQGGKKARLNSKDSSISLTLSYKI